MIADDPAWQFETPCKLSRLAEWRDRQRSTCRE
jgi:hypothetical protein